MASSPACSPPETSSSDRLLGQAVTCPQSRDAAPDPTEITVDAGGVLLPGSLVIPPDADGLVVFVHGSGGSRHSPRNQFVAVGLNRAGLGTLLVDLLTPAQLRCESRLAVVAGATHLFPRPEPSAR
jgi:hypothetical protein